MKLLASLDENAFNFLISVSVERLFSNERVNLFKRRRKLDELHRYDESKEVNDCVIVYEGSELHYWADKHERGSLESAVRNSMALGRTHYRLDLRELGVSLNIPCEKLLQMLAVLEVYAIDCYNKTTDHEYAIKDLSTEAEIDAYDFKVGYPEVPRFEL